ncbi:hypothetical protein [Streptomyces radicis]|uniref:Uncharacterized protein n=1 Tax=Streptomyces radicis TaxID=1750517 RepID=A0A3A9VWT4_9ACTN|nr:hypothetical protein [Streptomyces radicis]RKN05398.1 hypothetical protein D7319_25660 [Streptomyces radicis]RKN16906.1 hypothetical protein D7318_25025 [Streptomyces radicis]
MDPATAALTIGAVIVAKGCALLALLLRLRHERARRRYVVRLAQGLGDGQELELDDDALRLRITRAVAEGAATRDDRP